MSPQNSQQQQSPMTPDEAKASMGLATHLQSWMLPKGKPQATSQTPQSAQQPNPAPEPPNNQETSQNLTTEMAGLESRIFDELGVLKSEIQKAQPQESAKVLKDLKDQIDAALASSE